MMYTILIALFFLGSICLQVVVLPVLPLPFSLIPLHLMLGTLVMHRSDSIYGILWFIGAALLIPFYHPIGGTAVAYIITSIVGWFLERRLFASRSLYALLGLGGSVYVCFALTRSLLSIAITGRTETTVSHFLYGLLFMAMGLYICFLIARVFDRFTSHLIINPRIH